MKPGTRGLLTGVAVVVALACAPPTPPRQLPPVGDLMAFVLEPSGAPVALALFDGEGAFTDARGVSTGTLAPNAAGWTRLRADGYVTQWVKPLPAGFADKKLLLARLTPVQHLEPVDPRGEVLVTVGLPAAPAAVVRVPASGFSAPVTLRFTVLRPQHLGAMTFAPQRGGAALSLQVAFELDALADDGAAQQPLADVEVSVRHPARLGAPTLGAFDPAAGQWVMDAAACSRIDPEWARCRLAHLSTHGLFGGAAADSSGDEWADAESSLYGGRGSVDDHARAAMAFADRHPSEAGKGALMAAAGAATQAGRGDLVTSLVDRGRELVEDMIDIELHEEGCGHVTEMMHLLQQAQLLAVSQTLQNQLQQRIDKALNGCDVWVGWVHYTYPLLPTIPELEDQVFVEGGRTWTERHVVHLSRDDQGNFHGESTADVRFPNAVYRNDVDDEPDCGDDFIDMEAEGNPSTGRVRVLFEGKVEGDRWTVTKVSSEPLEALSLRTRYHAHKWWKDSDDVCSLAINTDQWMTWGDSYSTQLHKGFLGPTPPSLAEMLSEGGRSANPLGRGADCIHGFEVAEVVAQPGIWPFVTVQVGWNFFQVTPPK